MAAGRAAVAVVGCSSVLATGCGDGGDATTMSRGERAAQAATVNIASFAFAPEDVTVAAGGIVTFVNRDKAPHTAENTGEAGPARFDSGRLTRGQHRSITFTKPGTYPYYCVYHRFMEANVIVR